MSTNDETARYAVTGEEKLQWQHYEITMALKEHQRGTTIPMVIGSDDWFKDIVKPNMSEQAIKKGISQLFSSARTWEFLTNVLRLSFVGDGNTIRVKELRERLLRKKPKPHNIHDKRAHNTVGGVCFAYTHLSRLQH